MKHILQMALACYIDGCQRVLQWLMITVQNLVQPSGNGTGRNQKMFGKSIRQE